MAESNFKNRTLYHGDNLGFLRGMNSDTVDLVATDPPFNKGRDFHATPASLAAGARFQDRWSWERDVHQEWVDRIADDWPRTMNVIQGSRSSYGDDMGAFLCFMAVRLIEMRRVLKPNGSIYLHCDPTASHYLKELMDAIFGKKNFQNEIVWCYSQGGKGGHRFGKKHDIILFYSKSKNYTFNAGDVKIPMRSGSKSFGGRLETDADGRKYRLVYGTKNKKGETRYYKYYLDDGKIPEDWWTDINSLQSANRERTGYPTQKPLALYERIILASSNESDVVLDPFSGCATTCVAAERLNRQWVGVDIWDKAHEVVIQRLQKEGLIAPDGNAGGKLFTKGELTYSTEPPVRTDDNIETTAYLQVQERVMEYGGGKKWSRKEMYEILLTQHGMKCQGCDRVFDDSRYLELDHNTPRADGGINHISNRILLCSPCNRAKSNVFTLSGLRRHNKKNGWMAK